MRILFVCTGNTCRSCMAESIFNKLCNIEKVKAFSAGLSIVNSSKTSINSAETVRKKINVDISDRYAVQLTESIIEESDIVLTMTDYIKNAISMRLPKYAYKVFSINEYVGIEGDIVDPYGGNIDVYERTYEALEQAVNLLLQKLKEDKGIN